MSRLGGLAALAATLAAFAMAPPASAAPPPLFWQAGSGTGAGQVEGPRGIAADPGNGHVFVADQNNSRVSEFTAWGTFVKAWGFDVIATGPGNAGAAEVQSLTVKATSGTFTLTFGFGSGSTTGPLAWNASAADVEAALNALSTIGGAGGAVSVSGGPGDATGSTPYAIAFEEALGGSDVAQISINAANLGIPVGTVLNCAGGPTGGTGATTVAYQWLSNGAPAAGAGSNTSSYTTDSSDAGKAVQCRVTATHTAGARPTGAVQASTARFIVSPVPSPLPPTPPFSIPAPALPSGGFIAGGKLTCQTGTWTGVTAPFAFQWYRNGVALAGNGADTSQYTLQAADVASAAAFQCAVTGSNASGSVTKVSGNRVTASPAPVPSPTAPIAAATATSSLASSTATTTQGVAAFETCVPADGNACKAGVSGSAGAGQFNNPMGVALDSAGNVYVADFSALRVQKFSPEGEFLLMFGGGVNQGPGSPGNVCTAAHIAAGDTCGAGTTGAANGQFGWSGVGNLIAITPGDKVYVGDAGRIQRFNTAGVYQDQIDLPGEVVKALAADSAGNLYATYEGPDFKSKEDVRKLNPAGEEVGSFAVVTPQAVAVAPNGDVYAIDGGFEQVGIVQFDPAGNVLEEFAGDLNESSTGLAASDVTCGEGGIAVYFSNLFSPSFLRAYSPAPDPACAGPPPSVPPEISAQYAASVDTGNAELRAQVNPHFWEDTTYYVEYGTSECSSAPGACDQRLPLTDAQLGAGVVDEDVTTAGVFLGGLQPATTYHYRFVAESGGGGPVRGAGGTEAADGQEGTFTTYPLPSPHRTDCPNQAFRGGASAHLPDCRAYEMVSPVDKEGADLNVSNPDSSMEQSASDGEAFTYSTGRAFGQPQSAPLRSQYIARRDPGKEGWVSEAISPPREGPIFSDLDSLRSHYKAFSEDLCSAWNWEDTEPTLAPGAVAGFQNLYRRDNCGPGAGGFEALSTVFPPDFVERVKAFALAIQGFSADGSLAVFRAPGQLREDLAPCPPGDDTPTACPRRVYATQDGELALLSVLPHGAPSEAQNSVGTFLGQETDHTKNSVDRAVSADGSRVYWLTASTALDALYVRLNPMAAAESAPDSVGNCIPDPLLACTVKIAEAFNTNFWSAAADGHRAIYSTGLLSEAQLYEFDLATRASTLIAGGVLGVAGVSEDASNVYFVSRQVLSADPNSEGDTAEAGKPNLYHYVAGEGGGEDSYAFVATLAEADVGAAESARTSPVHLRPDLRSARVSPDGSHLAFASTAPATGYDSTDLASGEADAEVFLYDAAGSGDLACVSCNPSGARPAGRVFEDEPTAATIPGWPSQTHPSRALSGDGRRLFFESYDALLLADTNGKKDVYQWQAVPGEGAQGAAECEQLGAELFVESSGGCLSLVSSGTSPQESHFLDASADGRDVFIRTATSLVAHDPGLRDLYDAREGGGLPPPPVPAAACEGEACQGIASAPDDPTPASTAYQGSGNVTSPRPRCPKGKRAVRKAGKTRCLRKPRKQRGRANAKRHRADHDGRAPR